MRCHWPCGSCVLVLFGISSLQWTIDCHCDSSMNPCALCSRIHAGVCSGLIARCCKLCGEQHNDFVPCPCPRCLHQHVGHDCAGIQDWRGSVRTSIFEQFIGKCCRLCGQHHGLNPCVLWSTGRCGLCNDYHDGACAKSVIRGCELCGEDHPSSVSCPCPRCLNGHSCQCCSLITCALCNRQHEGACVGAIAKCCLLCGEVHARSVSCPCPRCLNGHSCQCCSLITCALCNRQHEGACVGAIAKCCLLCGEVHAQSVSCPCPRCLLNHVVGACYQAFSHISGVFSGDNSWCLLCGEAHQHNSSCPCPRCHLYHTDRDCPDVILAVVCSRCNVWHGADVCARRDVCSSMPQPSALPRAQMINRAVSQVAHGEMSAPVRSDAASDRHDIGPMSISCSHCGARFWRGERINCCFDGTLIIPEPDIPESLSNLILSSSVRQHLRAYNVAMAMASVGHEKAGFPDGVFVLSGKSYHHVGTMLPNDGHPMCFAQIYILDTLNATNRRSSIFGNELNSQVLSDLHDQLLLHNRYVSEFATAAATDAPELVWTSDDNIMGMQMGALVSAVGRQRSIVIKRRGQVNGFAHDLQFISDGHSLYHTLTYPLLFPTGQRGWFLGMCRWERNNLVSHSVTLHDYGRYMLMHRARSVHVAL
jgi:hypothetical protein